MNLSRCCLFSQLCTCSHKVYVCSLKVDICSLTVYTLSRSSLTVKSLFVFLSFYHTFFLPFSFHCVPNTASLLTVLQTLEFVNSCAYIYIYPHSHAQTNIRTHQNALFHSSLWPTNCKCKATRYRAKTLCTVCPAIDSAGLCTAIAKKYAAESGPSG